MILDPLSYIVSPPPAVINKSPSKVNETSWVIKKYDKAPLAAVLGQS